MTKARDIADFKFENITDTGTEGTKVASGTTAQRGSTTGQWRYNTTTGFFEGRNATGSFSTLEPTPVITSVDVTEVDSSGGGNETFVITGSNLSTGGTITFVGSTAQFDASTTTYNSATQVTAVAPKSSFLNAQEPYKIKFVASSGVAGTSATGLINVDTAPTWNTTSGTVATIAENATGNHVTLSATDAEGDTIAYSDTTGNLSGAGFSLDSATGVISGNPNDVSNATTVSFTGRATAGSKTTDRSFNIIVNPVRDVYFGILGAGGGGAGRESTSYQGSSDTRGAGGCGSFVDGVYQIPVGTTIYYYVGGGGANGTSSVGGASRTYGGDGKNAGPNDTSGEGGEFSGIFTANSISQANALMIAGGGGGGAGRPHGGGSGQNLGGGGIESATTGAGNHGTRGNNNGTLDIGSQYGGEGGRQNSGGRAGTADQSSNNNGSAGVALIGGDGSSATSWGNGGGGGGGFFGGGGGQDDGSNWGGGGGGAGSSFIRGAITNYTTSSFNTLPTNITLSSHNFRTQSWSSSGMRVPYDYSAFGTGWTSTVNSNGSKGHGGRENSGYPGSGYDGGHGAVFIRIGSTGSYTAYTSHTGSLVAVTIS